MEIDNGFKENGQPMRRFYLNRIKDETGISRTGRVLEGILTQSGKVITEWRPPMSTMGIYNSMQEFMTIHVDCHPSCNEVVWLDEADWLCMGCGCGNDGYFCVQCGSGRRDFIGRDTQHCRKCGTGEVAANYNFCTQCGTKDPLSTQYAFGIQDAMNRANLTDERVIELINEAK